MPAPNSTDSNFEKTFADLAYTRLRDKAPTLLDYLIGFQMLQKNDEGTHAVGVFGFKVGQEWVYAPVFFINGELKGHELMYIKGQDAFVPLVEEWVNYVLNRRPQVLGEAEQKPRGELGLRQPDFNLFAQVPYSGSKIASHQPTFQQVCASLEKNAPEYLPFMQVFTVSPRSEKYASADKHIDLRGALKILGKQAAVTLLSSMKQDAKFADAVLKFYDVKDLINFEKTASKLTKEEAHYQPKARFSFCEGCQNFSGHRTCSQVAGDISSQGTCQYYAAKKLESKIETIDPIKPVKVASDKSTLPVVVITRGDDFSNVCQDLSEEDKTKLLKNQYVVKDFRSKDQRSRLYTTQLAESITTPSVDGLYDLLPAKGGSLKALVITAPITVNGDWPSGQCLVIDPATKKFIAAHSSDVMVRRQYDRKDWNETFDKLSALSGVKLDDVVTFVTPNGQATVPFRCARKWSNVEGQTELNGRAAYMSATNQGMDTRHRVAPNATTSGAESSFWCSEVNFNVVLTGKASENITQIGNTLFVPAKCKMIKLVEPYSSDSVKGLELGSIPEVLLNIYKTAQSEKTASAIQVRTDGLFFSTWMNSQPGPSMSKVATIKHLILDHGLGQDDAEMLVKSATPRKATTYWVKYAGGAEYAGGVMNRPYFNEPPRADIMGVRAPVQYPQSEQQNLGGDLLSNREAYRDDIYIDDTAKMRAQQAASQGNKEVLDTAIVNSLVKTQDVDGLVDSYVSDLLLGLDRLGRVLFMLYQNFDQFKERYGSQDLVELEDNVRNVFKSLGEVTLYLKQKDISPEQSSNSEVKLDSVLN